jgi:diaminopimelate epimerase
VIAYPSGNTTAIVFDDIFGDDWKDSRFRGNDSDGRWDDSEYRGAHCDKKALNAALIRSVAALFPDFPEVEQCCAIVAPVHPDAVARVEMFGGEFCGNAARSAVRALTMTSDAGDVDAFDDAEMHSEGRGSYAEDAGTHTKCTGKIEVSGATTLLGYAVKNDIVHIEMPLPVSGCSVERVPEGNVVRLDGISHLVITDRTQQHGGSARSTLKKLLKEDLYGFADEAAAGVCYYDELTTKSRFCVWVRDVETMYDETSCGSGTCAIGAAIAAKRHEDTKLTIIQPSGDPLTVVCNYGQNGLIFGASIEGKVDILYDGPIRIETEIQSS